MENSKRYNSVPVKDNCALFAPTPLFSGPGYPTVFFKFFPCRPLLPWQRIFGQKLTTTRPSWKIIARCFYLHPHFRARALRWCHLNFSLPTPIAMATNFGTKLTITRLLHAVFTLFSGLGYAMVSCKFHLWRPLLSWQQTVFIQRQNWLQAHKSVKCWNAAARLYSVAMGQIPRSTERISSCNAFVTMCKNLALDHVVTVRRPRLHLSSLDTLLHNARISFDKQCSTSSNCLIQYLAQLMSYAGF